MLTPADYQRGKDWKTTVKMSQKRVADESIGDEIKKVSFLFLCTLSVSESLFTSPHFSSTFSPHSLPEGQDRILWTSSCRWKNYLSKGWVGGNDLQLPNLWSICLFQWSMFTPTSTQDPKAKLQWKKDAQSWRPPKGTQRTQEGNPDYGARVAPQDHQHCSSCSSRVLFFFFFF